MFGSKRDKGKVIVVADVESGSVGVCIMLVHAEGPADVLWAERKTLPQERSPDVSAATIGALLLETSEAALAAHRAMPHSVPQNISGVYAIINAPWAHSKTIKVGKKFDHEEVVGERIINPLAQQAILDDKDVDRNNMLEASVVRVALNGYPTPSPKGKRAHEVEVWMLFSDCDADILSMVRETLLRVFQTPLVIRSRTRALLSALQNRSIESKHYLVVDMASDATNMIAIHKGVTTDQAFVAEGTNSILKRIGDGDAIETTRSLLRMIARDECTTAACKKVSEALARAETDLVRLFGEALGQLVTAQYLGEDLFLITDADLADWLSHFFARIDFTQFTATARPFNVSFLRAEDLALRVQPTIPPDIGILIACSFVNTEEHSRA